MRKVPKACIKCNVTFWPKDGSELRCLSCRKKLKSLKARVNKKLKDQRESKDAELDIVEQARRRQ